LIDSSFWYSFHDNLADYADQPQAHQIGGALSKFQDAFKSYMAKDENRELAPEVADMVNKISDVINIGNQQQEETIEAQVSEEPTGEGTLNGLD
jgi:hypothetical protein